MAVRSLVQGTRQQTNETAPSLAVAADAPKSSAGAAASVRRMFRQNHVALGAACFVLLVVAAGLFAPVLAPYDPVKQSLLSRLDSPSPAHWLGTDEIGRDELSRLLYGARISLFIGFVGTAGGVLLGSLLGLVAGYFGGWTDTLLMRVIDIMYAFPGILLAILIVSIMGPGLNNLMIALTIWGTPTLSRIVRSVILSLKEQEFILAAQAMGAPRTRIIFSHLLPNTTAPIIVYATLGVAGSLLTAAGLGFLGIGVQPPTPEWGAMLSTGRGYLRDAPYLMIFPGVMIFLTVMSLNIAGDALRDALDPYLRS